MAAVESPPTPQNPRALIFVAFALATMIIGSCAAYYLWPRGDRLGAIDLRAATPSLSIDVGDGDKLTFRIETVSVGTVSGYPSSSRSRTNSVEEELRASKISITCVGSDGVVQATTECGAFAGKSTRGSSDGERIRKSGVPLDCSLAVPKAGVYAVSAKVAWVPKDVREAVVEVRRSKAAKWPRAKPAVRDLRRVHRAWHRGPDTHRTTTSRAEDRV